MTLWRDFDESLPLNATVFSESEGENFIRRELVFYGRETGSGRVRIYAQYYTPKGVESYPAVMVLFEAGFPVDEIFVESLVKRGYAVFCPDYCGENGTGKYTVYPLNVDYANLVRAGDHVNLAEPSARETSWYEWAAVARYGAKYLREQSAVTRVGAIGIRTGGEVLFKIAPYAGLSCMVSICAAGWLAYRGLDKFGDSEKKTFSEERHRFIAGIDSQSYAPYVKCPVLLLSAVNDPKYNYDRVYDTFRQINPEVEKALLFSAHGNGLIGRHSRTDMMLFLDKCLKDRAIYISPPVDVTVEEENGKLVAKGNFDMGGEIAECGIFFTENIKGYQTRDWTRVLADPKDLKDNMGTFDLNVYKKSDKVLLYSFVRYSNDFSVTSKIKAVNLEKKYVNTCPQSRVLYTSADGLNGFVEYRRRARSVADCFTDCFSDTDTGETDVHLEAGYGGILGITSPSGIVSHRVSEPRYAPPEGAMFRFDAYAGADTSLKVVFIRKDVEYACEVDVAGDGKWKNIVLEAGDFKSETGAPLGDFALVTSVAILFEGNALVNNVLWL